MKTTYDKNKAFTIIELVIVIFIIAVLAVVTSVSYSSVVKKANTVSRLSEMRGLAEQIELYRIDQDLLPMQRITDECQEPSLGYYTTCRVMAVNKIATSVSDSDEIKTSGHRTRDVVISPQTMENEYDIKIPRGIGYYLVTQQPFSLPRGEHLAFVLAEFQDSSEIPVENRIPLSTDDVLPLRGAAKVSQTSAERQVAKVDGYKITCMDGSEPAAKTQDGLLGGAGTWGSYRVPAGGGTSGELRNMPGEIGGRNALQRGTARFLCGDNVGGTIFGYYDNSSDNHRGAVVIE